MTTHELKIWPVPFAGLRSGLKRCEFRKDDRGFKMGDRLYLREWIPSTEVATPGTYTGHALRATISWIDRDGFGIPAGHAVLSIDQLVFELANLQGEPQP